MKECCDNFLLFRAKEFLTNRWRTRKIDHQDYECYSFPAQFVYWKMSLFLIVRTNHTIVFWNIFLIAPSWTNILQLTGKLKIFQVVDKHRSKYIKEHLPSLLNDFLHLNKYEAQNLVVTALCHETPIGYNMHLYRMTKEATGKQHSTVAKHCSSKHCKLQPTGECLQCNVLYLGIGPKGVEVFEVR